MRAIIKFTNILGEINHGIVIGSDPGGMLFVAWDSFTDLLTRLERTGKVNDFVRAGLSLRRSWCRVEDAIPNGSTTELLPITTPIAWHEVELAMLQRQQIQESNQPVLA